MYRFLITVVLVCALTATVAKAAGKATNSVPADAKCSVCGMFVAKYPDWTATAHLKNGSNLYFDGPKDLLTFYLDTARYAHGKRQSDISVMKVREYYSLESIDPRGAFFVVGSDVYGPMGSELIPLKSEKDAQAFKIDHKGKRIIRFNEITLQLIKTLN